MLGRVEGVLVRVENLLVRQLGKVLERELKESVTEKGVLAAV